MIYRELVLKPLKRVVGLDEKCYVIIDDNIANILVNKGNGILISPYDGSSDDFELLKISNFLLGKNDKDDIRDGIDSLYEQNSLCDE